jgi:hypothetical protein
MLFCSGGKRDCRKMIVREKNSARSAAGLVSFICAPVSDTSIKRHSRHHVPSMAIILASSGRSNLTRVSPSRSSLNVMYVSSMERDDERWRT